MKKSLIVALIATPVIALSGVASQVFAAETTTSPTAQVVSSVASAFGIKMESRGHMGPMSQLTDSEKTALESMTDAQKTEFFTKKMAEHKAKMDAREAVIDKLLAGESLTDADKVLVSEIKTERAKMKAERAQMDSIRTKISNNQALTTEEQAIVDAHKNRGHAKGGKNGQGKVRGESFSSKTQATQSN